MLSAATVVYSLDLFHSTVINRNVREVTLLAFILWQPRPRQQPACLETQNVSLHQTSA
jgi:hypothetical protein